MNKEIISKKDEKDNPLADLISNETFSLLKSYGLINEKSLRDYLIKKRFVDLKNRRVNSSEAIEMLRDDYPYLQFDTIRKIVYQILK
jgi:hypothetical protein